MFIVLGFCVVLSCCCVVNVVCCDLPASTDQRARGTFVQTFSVKGRIALQAGHASPVKWCLKEKVLLGKWSANAMLELQRIRFSGWALTEGQHQPKAGKKKKTREAGLFFCFPLRK